MKGGHQYLGETNKRGRGPEASGNNIALTPPWLVERVRSLLGEIDFDPCTTPGNPTHATRFITPPEDGILQSWEGRCYVNPPYGMTISKWTEKAALEAARGCRIVILVPSRTDARWFQRLANEADCLLFIKGRLQFGDTRNNAPFPSALAGFNVDLSPLADIGIVRKAA